MIFVCLLLGMLFLVVITWPFIVLTHELGHAIPALLLTSGPVTVYIGSHGEEHKSLRLRLGRLALWFRVGTFWNAGRCVAQAQQMSRRGQLVCILGGPLASSILAGLACYLIFTFELHGALKLYFVAFFLVALFDLVVNLLPRAGSVTPDGEVLYNDGYKLKMHWYYMHQFDAEYEQAVTYYNQQRYRPASHLFERFLTYNLRHEDIFRCAIMARYCLREYAQALALHEEFAAECTLCSGDYVMAGLLKGWLSQEQESMADYARALAIEPDNLTALHNQGYTLTLLGRYAEAITVLDQTLALDPAYAYAYNNRGFAKLKLGQVSEGLADVQHSLQLDPDNAYAYRNLGIYELEQNNKAAARHLFLQAHALNADTHLLPELLAQVP